MTRETRRERVRFEPSDVPPLLPLWLAGGLGGFVLFVLGGIAVFYPLADRQENRGPMQHLPPSPQLQAAPGSDLDRYKAQKLRELEHSPVPIQSAMRATAQQGWGPPK